MINHGDLQYTLVAIVLCLVGMLLMPWGVHWLTIVGLAVGGIGLVIGFLVPLIGALVELVIPPFKHLFCHGRRNPCIDQQTPTHNDAPADSSQSSGSATE
jgi:hypothetical protein